MHLEPKFSAAMDADTPEVDAAGNAEAGASAGAGAGAGAGGVEAKQSSQLNVKGALSTSDGVLGAICTSCYVQVCELVCSQVNT